MDNELTEDQIERVQTALASEATHRVIAEHVVEENREWLAYIELHTLIPGDDWERPYVVYGERFDDPRSLVRIRSYDRMADAEAAYDDEKKLIDAVYGPDPEEVKRAKPRKRKKAGADA